MSTRNIITLFAALLLSSLGMQAQNNTLSTPNIKTAAGRESILPINLDNTTDVVAVQFNLSLPVGLHIPREAVVTDRTSSHTVSGNEMYVDDFRHYTIILLSADNSVITGRSGAIINLPLYADEDLTEGTVLQPSFSDVIIATRDGSNVATGHSNGTITISPSPDLVVKNVTTDASAIAPGDNLAVNWTVENIGGWPTTGGWSEQIALIGNDGSQKMLATTYFDATLNDGGQVSRNADITVPDVLGIDGDANICVKLIPNSDSGEPSWSTDNNTSITQSSILIEKKLVLTPSAVEVEETSKVPLKFLLSRSGNVSEAESFSIEGIKDSRIEAPSNIMIPKGQSGVYVYLKIHANQQLDDTESAVLNISSNEYGNVNSIINIRDDTDPSLALTFSKDEVTEGENIDLKITANRAPKEDTEISLTCELPGRFLIPAIVLPAGKSEITATLSTIDDDIPDVTQSVMFTAWAMGYCKTSDIIDLNDNDMPTLQFSLLPDAVSESSGPVSVTGKLTRVDKFDKSVTIKFSDDSNGNIYYGRETVEMAPGIKELTVNLGPIDNSLVDGERTYNITAAVWIASCSCNASNGTSGGHVSVPLTVFDDDGPALTMTASSSIVKEGGDLKMTVSRNTETYNELTVNISSDHDSRLEFPSSVIIPAGMSSASFIVKSISKDTDNEDLTIVMTAESEGFAKSKLWFMVSDRTLPDAEITDINVSENEIEVGRPITFEAAVVNNGSYVLPEMTPMYIYRRGDVNPLAKAFLQSDLLPNESTVIEKTIALPDAVGRYSLYAVINEDRNVKELLYSNNTSSNVEVTVKSPYTFTLKTDKDRYNQNEVISITGSIKGKEVANKNVDVYVINEGVRQVFKSISDENGSFKVDYEPYSGQMGHFVAGACYPNEKVSDPLASFDVYGLKRSSNQPLYCEVTIGEDYNGVISISNPGNLSITDIRTTVKSAPENCNVLIDSPSELPGGATGKISFTLTPTDLSMGNDWQSFVIGLSSKEGASDSIPVNYYCYNKVGKINSSIAKIKTTMVKDGIRDYPFEISNIGKGSTGKISLALPDWMAAATPMEMAPLEKGESTTIILRFVPTDEMQLNVPVTGQIGINCEKGDGMAIPFSIEPVSDASGTLTIDVCDEYTYYTEEAPHVSGAEVRVSHPTTGTLIASGYTDDNGKFSTILNEGYYAITVTAPNHDGYSNNVLVDPSSEKNITVNLSIEAITVGWSVEETEVKDEYKIVTTAKFETNVPTPVVELAIPESIPAKDLAEGESLIFNAILTNKGLITAQDVEFIAPDGFTYLSFEPLANTEPFSLAPKQSVVIPVKVTHVNRKTTRVRPIDNDPCVGQPGTLYAWDCGTDRKWHRYSIAMQVGSCNSNDSTSWDNSANEVYSTRGGGWYPVPHTGFGGGTYGPTSNNDNVSTHKDEGCEPCQNQFLLELIDCGLQLIPAYRTLKNVIQCVQSVNNAVKTAQSNPTPKQLTSALLDATSSCAAAKGEGSGDKNQSRAEKREEAISEIIETAEDIYKKLSDEESEWTWDDSAEVLGSLAQSLSKLAGFDFDNLAELFCPLKLFKPCDKEGDTDTIPAKVRTLDRVLARSAEPSYIQEFRKALALPFVDQIALISMQHEFYGDVCWLNADQEQLDTFFDLFYSSQDENECIPEQAYESLMAVKPENISKDQLSKFIERWNNSIRDDNRDNCIDLNKIDTSLNLFDYVDSASKDLGFESFADLFEVEYEKCRQEAENQSKSVCSSITLQFSQSMVLTRQAFRGTLTVFNGNETTAMSDIKLALTVKDTNGNIATSHEFQINPESISGFDGELSLTDGWSLESQETGVASILFIPTKHAAPTTDKVYSFGGTLSYVDPFTGLVVTRVLSPVFLTVKPSPILDLTYFMQRDVLGDDPLTEEIEPSEEAEFSLLITNNGYGDATNLMMVTDQPQIIENEKGLLIDFELISSQLNGGEKTLALGNSVATDFGTIPAKSSAYAQWWLKSSLLGHFTDYNVEATHVSSYGNPDLSLLNEVAIHELIRSIDVVDGDNTLKGFMTNDIIDASDMPDMLYMSNGEIEPVMTASASDLTKKSDTEYILTISPSSEGWNYGRITDPTYGQAKLKHVVRQKDGQEISLRNFWQTDRTLRDGKDPLYENIIHFVDNFNNVETDTYRLVFEPIPDVMLEVESIEGLPASGTLVNSPIEKLTVIFNKPIDKDSFTTDDISISVEGKRQDASHISITTEDSKSFFLDLSELNKYAGQGFYTLTVMTSAIKDTEGFAGKNGKSICWNYVNDGFMSIAVKVNPDRAGYITRLDGESEHTISSSTVIQGKYGETMTLVASANEGYEFEEWSNFGSSYSFDPEIRFIVVSNDEFIARFVPKSYYVEIDDSCLGGSILGKATGYYSYGEELTLIAAAEEGFIFKNWIVNDEETGTDPTLTLTVKGESRISAVFEEGSGVGAIAAQRKVVVFSIDGLLIDDNATLETIKRLEKGVYIINGVKCMIQ